ncbi:hypothetical protein DITRI_Ditri03aG0135400 [Diplodiscus trichospermus]
MVAAAPELAAKVCSGESVSDKDFCMKALDNPQAAAAKNMNQLSDVVLKSAATNAQNTLNLIATMTKTPTTPGGLKALKTCEDVYRYAVKSFGMISKEMSEDAMSANYDVSVIGPEADRCASALAAAKVVAPQIADGNRALQHYSAMGGEITATLN